MAVNEQSFFEPDGLVTALGANGAMLTSKTLTSRYKQHESYQENSFEHIFYIIICMHV